MDKTAERAGFERGAAYGERAGQIIGLARAAKNHPDMVRALAACLAHAAFAAPDRIAEIYDEAAVGWRGRPVTAAPLPAATIMPEALWETFWSDYWRLVDDAAKGMGAGEITTRTAALASHLSPNFQARAAAAGLLYPGVNEAAQSGIPPRFKLEALAAALRNEGTLVAIDVDPARGADLRARARRHRISDSLESRPPDTNCLAGFSLRRRVLHTTAGRAALVGFRLGRGSRHRRAARSVPPERTHGSLRPLRG